jgi:hypothetical protein
MPNIIAYITNINNYEKHEGSKSLINSLKPNDNYIYQPL